MFRNPVCIEGEGGANFHFEFLNRWISLGTGIHSVFYKFPLCRYICLVIHPFFDKAIFDQWENSTELEFSRTLSYIKYFAFSEKMKIYSIESNVP